MIPRFLRPKVFPYASVEIVREDVIVVPAPLEAPVVVPREPTTREDESNDGDACSSWCGYCGRCSSGPRANAECSDCQAPFWKGRDDVGNLCDDCCTARDAHTDALERRMADVAVTMVKAALAAPKKTEVA